MSTTPPNEGIPEDLAGAKCLSVNQVLQLLNICRSTLYGLMHRTKHPIPNILVGRVRRFPVDKLLWWMENLEQWKP